MTLGEKTIEVARLRIGTREIGENWGPAVRAYLAFVGIFRPAPWCAAWVALMVHNAAKQLGVKAQWPKAGLVQNVVNWAKKHSEINAYPYQGWAFVVYHPELKRYAHIGFIADVDDKGRFLTIEGNSNTTGAREGTEVVSKWRKWNPKRHKAIRIA